MVNIFFVFGKSKRLGNMRGGDTSLTPKARAEVLKYVCVSSRKSQVLWDLSLKFGSVTDRRNVRHIGITFYVPHGIHIMMC